MLGSMKSLWLAVAACAALALASCGREPTPDPVAPGAEAETSEAEGEPLPPPRAIESLDDATNRLRKALEAGGCEDISAFNLSSRPTADEEARCNVLIALLGGSKVLGSEEFKAGGVADFDYGETGASAVFVVEDDGRYHLAYVDTLLQGVSAGTRPAREFDAAAAAAFVALRDRDCAAFAEVANPRHGPGALDGDAACDYVEANPVPGLAASDPELEPELLGANADYALYGLATPEEFVTMVLGRAEDPEDLPASYDPLPEDAPEFGFVDLITVSAIR